MLLLDKFREPDLRVEPTSLYLRGMNNPKYVSWTCGAGLSEKREWVTYAQFPMKILTLTHAQIKFGSLTRRQKLFFSLFSIPEPRLKRRISVSPTLLLFLQ